MARNRIRTMAELEVVEGFGKVKKEKFGEALLEGLAKILETENATKS